MVRFLQQKHFLDNVGKDHDCCYMLKSLGLRQLSFISKSFKVATKVAIRADVHDC